MSKALNYLGIARMSGNIELGEDNAATLVKAGKARMLIVAGDTSDAAKRRAEGYVFGRSAPLVEVPFTKQEISEITGKPGCSMAAIRDMGLAKSFADSLAEEYGAPYTEVSAALGAKLAKMKARKSAGRKSGNRRKSE